ncbi:MAG: DUF4387 domain-containing protein [Gammaproteobacteria bacterium]|nr:DUF4387 domain-containing protein [Gammaproteobacteria bacterium]
MTTQTLGELADIVRSKNAGALLLTIDVMFDDQDVYARVLKSGAVSRAVVAQLYGVSENAIDIIQFDLVRAIKVTFPRATRSGDPDDGDIYGAQQHVPMLSIPIPL